MAPPGAGASPSKAPPPRGKAPPPPKAGGAFGKAPPPRGGGAAAGPKLRPIFWTAAQQVPNGSIWGALGDPAPFDKAMLEKQFALAPARPVSKRASGEESVLNKPKLRVLDDGTSQLLAIAFARLPPPKRFAEIIETLEDFPEGLPPAALLAAAAACVEQRDAVEQIRQLDVSGTKIEQLDLPERYLWIIGSVSHCPAKLACGALIIGSAGELPDFRRSSQKVGLCCQAIRRSNLLRRCISTGLAVGNFLNRGTSRENIQHVVLPESLLKLDELRGVIGDSTISTEGSEQCRGPSLLDFVSQALVDEAAIGQAAPDLEQLKVECGQLLRKVRAAQSVSLEESEKNCQKVLQEAQRARQGLESCGAEAGQCTQTLSKSNYEGLSAKVYKICEEADYAMSLITSAKEELSRTQRWSSAKGTIKSDEWFSNWAIFLEQLGRALSRTRACACPTAPASLPPVLLAASVSLPAVPPKAARRPSLCYQRPLKQDFLFEFVLEFGNWKQDFTTLLKSNASAAGISAVSLSRLQMTDAAGRALTPTDNAVESQFPLHVGYKAEAPAPTTGSRMVDDVKQGVGAAAPQLHMAQRPPLRDASARNVLFEANQAGGYPITGDSKEEARQRFKQLQADIV